IRANIGQCLTVVKRPTPPFTLLGTAGAAMPATWIAATTKAALLATADTALKSLSQGKSALIALTGWGQEEDRRRSHQAGFDYHMVKPVDPHELVFICWLGRFFQSLGVFDVRARPSKRICVASPRTAQISVGPGGVNPPLTKACCRKSGAHSLWARNYPILN